MEFFALFLTIQISVQFHQNLTFHLSSTARACPCKARTFLSQQASRVQAKQPEPVNIIHTPDCLHNPANVEILSDLVVVNNHDDHSPSNHSRSSNDPVARSSEPAKARCCKGAPASQNTAVTGSTQATLTSPCCPPDSSTEKPPISLLEALQNSDSSEPRLVAYYIHSGDGKLCSRVEAQKTPQGHLTTKPTRPIDQLPSQLTPPSGSLSASSYDDLNLQSMPIPLKSVPAMPSQLHNSFPQPSDHHFSTRLNPGFDHSLSAPHNTNSQGIVNDPWIGPSAAASDVSHPANPGPRQSNTKVCICGDKCSCVGCPEHFGNNATMEYVLYHVAAADITSPSMNATLHPDHGNQPPESIPQEWTAYEDAFDFMSHRGVNFNCPPSIAGIGDQYGMMTPWLQPAFEPANLVPSHSQSTSAFSNAVAHGRAESGMPAPPTSQANTLPDFGTSDFDPASFSSFTATPNGSMYNPPPHSHSNAQVMSPPKGISPNLLPAGWQSPPQNQQSRHVRVPPHQRQHQRHQPQRRAHSMDPYRQHHQSAMYRNAVNSHQVGSVNAVPSPNNTRMVPVTSFPQQGQAVGVPFYALPESATMYMRHDNTHAFDNINSNSNNNSNNNNNNNGTPARVAGSGVASGRYPAS